MTTSDPDVLRQQIEGTRRELSYDVDALNEKVNPARVKDRKVAQVKGRFQRMKDSVMGSAHQTGYQGQDMASAATDRMQSMASQAGDMAQQAGELVQQAPERITRQARGNPLAAGLIAFGVGWLVSSLMPASEKEKELAQQAESKVREHSQPVMDQAKQMAQEMGDQLKPVAQQAVEEVKSTAQDAATTVKEEGKSAAQDVQGQAQDSKETVQSQASSNT